MSRISVIYMMTFRHPAAAFRSLLAGNYFRNGFICMLIPISLYTLMYVFLFQGGGAPSTFTPWLNISRENYYIYNQFLLVTSLLLSWVFASATMQILARSAGGTGTFEQTPAVTGLSTSVAMWGTLLHDLLMSFFSMVHVIDARQHEIAMNTPTIWRTSDTEWSTLTTFLGGEWAAGGPMKEEGTVHWFPPNSGATNSSGFTALPGGDRHSDNNFYNLNSMAWYWAATEESGAVGWFRTLFNFLPSVDRNTFDKANGFSVRCVHD